MRRANTLIIGVRVLIVAIATAAVVVGFVVAGRNDDGAVDVELAFVCPMHPEVRASSPDAECPICHMALVAKDAGAGAPKSARRADEETERDSLPLAAGAELRAMRDFVRPQVRVSAREMRGPAWAATAETGVALLYRDEIALLGAGEDGELVAVNDRPAAAARGGIRVRLTAEPPEPRDAATALVHFRVDPPNALAFRGTGWLKLRPRARSDLEIPAAAVIQSPAGPYVLVVAPDSRTLVKRPVALGRVLFGYAAVVSGVTELDRIVAMNTFFLDAERRAGGGPAPAGSGPR
jgi:multidrug efflux pump subunit AcrA (membrane-fusion protein)